MTETTSAKHSDDYHDLPGTIVFDGEQAHKGYHLNNFFMSLMEEKNRISFKNDERRYMRRKFPDMTKEQRDAVVKRDWNRMLELGAVVYAMAKLGFTDKHSYQFMASEMTGTPQEEYADMMKGGGRRPTDPIGRLDRYRRPPPASNTPV